MNAIMLNIGMIKWIIIVDEDVGGIADGDGGSFHKIFC